MTKEEYKKYLQYHDDQLERLTMESLLMSPNIQFVNSRQPVNKAAEPSLPIPDGNLGATR